MKKMRKIASLLFVFVLALTACQDDDHTFGDINTPANLTFEGVIRGKDNGDNPNGDGSGIVNFTATATNAINYKYIFSDGSSVNSPTGAVAKRFNTNGTNVYTVTVIASGTGGVSTSLTKEITVYSNFKDDEAVQFLTGGSSKKWYIAANLPGHLGVGPNNSIPAENAIPKHYAAQPWEKAAVGSCLYDNELTFTLDGETLKFSQNNFGNTFFNAKYLVEGGGVAGPDDQCLPYNTSGQKTVILSPSESILMTTNPDETRGTAMTFTDGGFMSYYIKQTTYEILSVTDNTLAVRAIMGGDESLAWYLLFTTNKPVQAVDEDFTELKFSDEFDVDGAPDPAKWTYDIGTGNDGWGNQEAQYYTDRPENAVIQGGKLKITAKKETFGGKNYTSARLKSEGLYDFKYGKIEFSAKLPTGNGTWPALWMLGKNYNVPGMEWPNCGEIDVMEHKGNEPNIIHGTLHYPGHSAGSANSGTKTITDASTAFHKYSAVWTATSVKIYVDDVLYHSVANSSDLPFNANFFLIMNVAMGGAFGGAIDPAFTQSAMEVDYVRVYQ